MKKLIFLFVLLPSLCLGQATATGFNTFVTGLSSASNLTGAVIPVIQGGSSKKFDASTLIVTGNAWASTGTTTVTTPTITGNPTFNGIPLISGASNYLDINNGNVAGGVGIYLRSTQGATYGDFAIATKDVNFGDTELDFITTLGMNMSAGGGRIISGKNAFGIQFERHFAGISSDDFEWHLKQVLSGGSEFRYISLNARKDDGRATGFMTFESLNLKDYTSTVYATFTAGTGQFTIQGTNSAIAIQNTTPTTGGILNLNGLSGGGASISTGGGVGSLAISNSGQIISLTGSTALVTFATGVNSSNGLDIHQNSSGSPSGVQITFGSQATQFAYYSSGNASTAARIDLINTNTGSGNSIVNIQAGTSGTGKSFIDFQTGSALNMFVGTDASGVYHVGKTSGWASNNFFQIDQSGNATLNGNFTLGTASNKLFITEGSSGSVGQTTLVSGTKAVTVTGTTTSTRCFAQLETQGGTVTTTVGYSCKCTSNTVTITAVTNALGTNTTDTSVVNYWIVN